MKKRINIFHKINLILLCFIIINLCAQNVFAIPSATKDIYVHDFAQILDSNVKNYIISQGEILENKTSAQLVVVTVNSLEEIPIEDYAISVLREWGIGDKTKNNGVLILLSKEDRKVKIEVGYGLEGAINDGKSGRILDTYAVPHFKNDEWSEGIRETYIMLLSEIYKEYNIEVPEDVDDESKNLSRSDDPSEYVLITGALIVIVLLVIFGRRRSFFIGGGPGPFIGPGGFSDGGFGGGFGSGGSGGGFGGGSSGGGGASRGF